MEVTWRYVKKSEVCSGEKLERMVMTSKSSKVGKIKHTTWKFLETNSKWFQNHWGQEAFHRVHRIKGFEK